MREQKFPYFWLTLTAILGTIITALSLATAPFAFDNPLFPNIPSIAALSGFVVGSIIMAAAAFPVLKRQNSSKGSLSYSVALLAIGADLTLGNYLAGTLEIYYGVAIMATLAAVGILGLVYSNTQMKKTTGNPAPRLVDQPLRTDALPENQHTRGLIQESTIIPAPIDSNINDRNNPQIHNNSSSSSDTTFSTTNNTSSTPSTLSSVDEEIPTITILPFPEITISEVESPSSNEVETTTTVQQATTPPSLIRTTTPSLTDSSDDERTQIDINLKTISELLANAWKTEKKHRTTQNKDKIIETIIETLELGATIPLIMQQFKLKNYNSDFIVSLIEPLQKKCSEENTSDTIKFQIPLLLKTLEKKLKKKEKNEVLEAIKIYFDTLQPAENNENTENFGRGCKNIITAIQDFGAKSYEISLILAKKFNDKTFMQEMIKHFKNIEKQSPGRFSKTVEKEIGRLMTDLDTNIRLYEHDQKRLSTPKWNNMGGKHYISYTTPNVRVPPKGYPPEPANSPPEARLESPTQEKHKEKPITVNIPKQLKEFAETDLTNSSAANAATQLVQSFSTIYFDDLGICSHLQIAKILRGLSNDRIKFLLKKEFWKDHELPRSKVENRVIQRLLTDLLTSRKEIPARKEEAKFIVENYLVHLSAETIANHLRKTYTSTNQHIDFLNSYWPRGKHEILRQAVEEQMLNKTPKPKTTTNEIKEKKNNGGTQPQDTKSSKVLTTFFQSPKKAPKETKQRIPIEELLNNFSTANKLEVIKQLESRLQWQEIAPVLVNGIWNNQLTIFDANFIVTHLEEPLKANQYAQIEKAKDNKKELENFLKTHQNQEPYSIQSLVKLLKSYELTDKTLVYVLNQAYTQGYISEKQRHSILLRYFEPTPLGVTGVEADRRYNAIRPLLQKKEPPRVLEQELDERHIADGVLRILNDSDSQNSFLGQ